MFRKTNKQMNNKGAALVLVIICMLFVGIIAAAVLTITLGNVDSAKTSGDSSENFYDTENFVDDLKLYLQKYANQAATMAYAAQINNISVTGHFDEAAFQSAFNDQLNSIFTDAFVTGINVKAITGQDTVDGLAFNPGTYNTTTHKLEGVEIKFGEGTGRNGYATTIYTDIGFDAEMPDLSKKASTGAFEYDIDKYILISNNNIELNGANGSVIGNIYSGGNTLVDANGIDTSTTAALTFSVDRLVVGGKLIMDGTATQRYQGFTMDLADVPEVTSYPTSSAEHDIWANEIDVKGKAKIKGMDVYLEDDLTISAENAKYETEAGGTLRAYSTVNTITDDATEHRNSGAVVINGKGSTVDLSALTEIVLAGTAYTEIPDVALGGDAATNEYFVQGESITYKSLQTAYLVDGGILSYTSDGSSRVGRNPMDETAYTAWNAHRYFVGSAPTGVDSSKVQSGTSKRWGGFNVKAVQYTSAVGAETYYYVYWDFDTATNAVLYGSTKGDQLEAKIASINGGRVLLPSNASVIKSKGNVIQYDGTFSQPATSSLSSVASSLAGYVVNYGKLMTTLSKSGSLGSESLINRVFYEESLIKEYREPATLDFPSGTKLITGYNAGAPIEGSNSFTYKLVTGENIWIGSGDTDGDVVTSGGVKHLEFKPESTVKYVVIATGDVKLTSSDAFNGIIIAKGSITSTTGEKNLKCFGNIKTSAGVYMSEFDALLGIPITSSSTEASKTLKKIFGVSFDGASGAGSSLTDIASVGTYNFTINS